MSSGPLSVKPGSPQQLSGAPLAKGSTVFNADISNGVWIGSDQTVAPNISGWLLAPQMSLDWTGKQLWACVDTGVAVPVTIEVSDDVQNVNNPVGVAEAIAFMGVPATFLGVRIDTGGALAPGGSEIIPTNQYASIVVFADNAAAGNKLSFTIFWYSDKAGTLQVAGDNFTLGDNTVAQEVVSWEMPVRGASMKIILNATSTGNMGLNIFGSNRSAIALRQILTTVLPRNFALNQNVVNGTAYQLLPQDGLGVYTCLNGECNFAVTQAPATNGELAMLFTQFNCTEGTYIAGTGTQFQGLVKHPCIPVNWKWIALATQAAQIVAMTIVSTSESN